MYTYSSDNIMSKPCSHGNQKNHSIIEDIQEFVFPLLYFDNILTEVLHAYILVSLGIITI